MARILCIDFGMKRTGIAVSDPLQIIATGLTTIESWRLIPFLKEYLQQEKVETILIGYPLNLDGEPTHATPLVDKVIKRLKKEFPTVDLQTIDESFTSKRAKESMLEMGLKKKERRKKELVDEIAATIMLQEFMKG